MISARPAHLYLHTCRADSLSDLMAIFFQMNFIWKNGHCSFYSFYSQQSKAKKIK